MPFQLSEGPIPLDGDGKEVAGSITLPIQLSFLPGRAKNKFHMTMGAEITLSRAGEVIATARTGVTGGMLLSLNNGLTVYASPDNLATVMLDLAEALAKKVEEGRNNGPHKVDD